MNTEQTQPAGHNLEGLFTLDEAAKMLGKSNGAIQAQRSRKKLGTRIGNQWFLSQEEVNLMGSVNPRGGRPKVS